MLYGGLSLQRKSWRDVAVAFPIAFRAEWRLALVMAVLLYGFGAAAFLAVRHEPERIFTLVGAEHARQMEQMYDPEAPHMGAPRP